MSHPVQFQEVCMMKNIANPKYRVFSLHAAVFVYFFSPLVYTSCYNNEDIFEGSATKH